MESWIEPKVPGLGETQRKLLAELKRKGRGTTAELATLLELSAGTLREHLNALAARGLVERSGTRREGPGRPEIIYSLTKRGESLFPRGESELLAEFVRHLLDTGQDAVLNRFFETRVDERRGEAERRIRGLEGERRRKAVAQIFTEAGFMAEVGEDEDGAPLLRLCHCPLRAVVDETHLPCKAEIELLQDLVGSELERIEHIPDGDSACSYRLLPAKPRRNGPKRRS
jgi:predicted ArsR family transcriptional regulator